jgi:hypothetical protein
MGRCAVLLFVTLVACSDSTTTTQDLAVADLAAAHDLSSSVRGCGIDDPPLTCPGLTPGAPNCWICDYGAPQPHSGVGACARACNGPSDCTPAQHCVPFSGDGGSAMVQTANCNPFTGFCR